MLNKETKLLVNVKYDLPISKLIDTSSAIKLHWPLVHIEPRFQRNCGNSQP